jgi:hypothetical protein
MRKDFVIVVERRRMMDKVMRHDMMLSYENWLYKYNKGEGEEGG